MNNPIAKIHPTAVIDTAARLGENVRIGPYAVIESNVEIGDDCDIGAHAVIKQHTQLGKRNTVHEHAVIGGTPQYVNFPRHETYVEIGDDNVLREGVTVQRSIYSGQATKLGNHNYLMAYAHVAHDCVVGNNITISNNGLLAGHVTVGDRAFVSAAVGIHQFCRVGTLAMLGGVSKITQDCLPYITTDGNPARARGLNVVGLKRAGVSPDERSALKRAYRILFGSHLSLNRALEELDGIESDAVRQLSTFIRKSERGFAHAS